MKKRLSPIAQKRLRRFVRHRRAWISAWIFAAITLAALAADLLANSKPLIVRFNSRTYFPAFRFYPASAFLPEGGASSPDYKAIKQLPVFTANKANFMLFAPIPYGPSETIDEQKLADQTGAIRIQLAPIARAASVDLAPDYSIARHLGAGFFLDTTEEAVPGTRLDQLWTIPATLREAIDQRFRNEPAPAFSTTIALPHLADTRMQITLPPFSQRTNPPRTVRITLRLAEPRERALRRISILPGRGPLAPPQEWYDMRQQDRDRLLALTPDSLAADTPFEIESGFYRYQVMPTAGITWPHPPVKGHPFGIDGAGRDVLARIIHGLRVSLFFSLLLVAVSMSLGTLIGAIQGYYGGKVDILVQRSIEIWSAIPFLYVMILLGSIYGSSFVLLLFCYAIFNWIGISFYMRGEFLRLRNAPFVDAARVLGLRDHQIIVRHILPNALTPIITFAPFSLVGAIASLAALDYLGFGLPALTPSLGQLLHQAQTYRTAWWLTLYPSFTLFIVILLGVFIGEGVREACDPRPRIRLE
ncbi:MAG: ABC transporter permease subunit [Kiritimatiellia bacterium]